MKEQTSLDLWKMPYVVYVAMKEKMETGRRQGALFEINPFFDLHYVLLPYSCKNNSTFRGKGVFNVDLFSTELIIFAGFNG